jgi:hypothetical protein
MSLLVIRCTQHRCQCATAIDAPNDEWKLLLSTLLDAGWVFSGHQRPQRTLVTRSVAAGLGRQRLRRESMITIYACCPRCTSNDSHQRA